MTPSDASEHGCICRGTGLVTRLAEGGGNTGPEVCDRCYVPKSVADGLAESCVSIARDRDQQVALYEAAMNWFDVDDWRQFEESDGFKEAEGA